MAEQSTLIASLVRIPGIGLQDTSVGAMFIGGRIIPTEEVLIFDEDDNFLRAIVNNNQPVNGISPQGVELDMTGKGLPWLEFNNGLIGDGDNIKRLIESDTIKIIDIDIKHKDLMMRLRNVTLISRQNLVLAICGLLRSLFPLKKAIPEAFKHHKSPVIKQPTESESEDRQPPRARRPYLWDLPNNPLMERHYEHGFYRTEWPEDHDLLQHVVETTETIRSMRSTVPYELPYAGPIITRTLTSSPDNRPMIEQLASTIDGRWNEDVRRGLEISARLRERQLAQQQQRQQAPRYYWEMEYDPSRPSYRYDGENRTITRVEQEITGNSVITRYTITPNRPGFSLRPPEPQ